MMDKELSFDPAGGEAFWSTIQRIPGYPIGESIPLKCLLIESGALFRMPEALNLVSGGSGGEVLVVMDSTPMRRAHADLKPLALQVLQVAGFKLQVLVLNADGTGQVHTDMPHIEMVKGRIHPDISVVSIGSGVVTDIAKHACYLYDTENGTHTPFLVYQTANSVSAYTSNMAPVFVEGVKRTLPSRYPDALVSDLETLRDAPREMTLAGVGDLLAAFISFPDWYLAYRLGMDPSYNELPIQLMSGLDQILLANGESIRQTSLPGMAILAKLIHLGGLAVSLAHATSPLSGYEHVMSHILDMLNEAAGLPFYQHGTQVALASILCSRAYQEFLKGFNPAKVSVEQCYPSSQRMRAHILDVFSHIDPTGRAGDECWSDYHIKLEKWSEQRENLLLFLSQWQEIRAATQALTRTPEVIQQILRAVDAPTSFDQLTPPVSIESTQFAFFNAPLMRRRLTLGDLLIFFQWDRQALWDQINPPLSQPHPSLS
jgi:glycerol-1-phosphate dehydrogenase [NAD(P)+]